MKSLLTALVVAFTVSSASAMDFAKTITLMDGTVMRKTENGPPLLMADVIVNALTADYRDEPNLDKTEKNKRYWLAQKIYLNMKDPPLSPEEIATIKTLVAKAFNPLVMGEVWHEIDPASVPDEYKGTLKEWQDKTKSK